MFNNNSLCSIPAFFYPTTVILVDDQPEFTKTTALALAHDYKTISFSDPDKAIAYFSQKSNSLFNGKALAEKYNGDVTLFRHEIYNPKRFDDAFASVLDYDMPGKNGVDVMKSVGLMDYYNRNLHTYTLLTAKPHSEFAKEAKDSPVADGFISKWDPSYIKQLRERLDYLSAMIFQGICHGVASALSHDPNENTSFLFDGNFLSVLNPYIQQHDIREGYMFDKQGSLLLLDKNAHLNWLFIRNEQGIQNSIQLAKEYHAPSTVIEALESKKVILSLYERADFERRKTISWDDYLVPAQVFKDEGKEFEVFNHRASDYYYAFTKDLPEHGIEQNKILSYAEFLQQK
jgi:CheY-like chemotaxis protein